MNKIFAYATLAAFSSARGSNDGSSRNNAVELQLFFFDSIEKMTLSYYNDFSSANHLFVGELLFTNETLAKENAFFGFCINQ